MSWLRSRQLRPSLRRRLLIFLLIPMATLLLLDAGLTYGVALHYANHVHDQDLSDDAITLSTMLGDKELGNVLAPQARFLLEYDPGGRDYFAVSSSKRGLLAGNPRLLPKTQVIGAAPTLYDTRLDKHALRAATVATVAPHDAQDILTITVAETLRDRHAQARDILLLASLMQTFLLVCVLLLVWFGVSRGLRVLEPLTARLAARMNELTPIGGPDVPQEILPLTRTIDALFDRLRAAHQLRTPLAGLSLHVDRALADPQPATVADALMHIHRLTQRAARTTSQLLALTRAQAPALNEGESHPLDLARLIPDAVALRVHEALGAGIDLGYAAPAKQPLWILGDASRVLDLLDNLIDNCLHYAGRGSSVTVTLESAKNGAVTLKVEDNGPGVPPDLLPHLSERFFRAPGSNEEGSGLGLSIVQSIAERHHAEVIYQSGEAGGLCVEVCFPSVSMATWSAPAALLCHVDATPLPHR